MIDKKITLKYTLIILITVVITWVIHEFAHWLTSELFGYKTIMRLNGTSNLNGEIPTNGHSAIISTAGPLITFMQAIIVFPLLKHHWNKYLYPILFTAFYMRLLAGLMNFINTNDEGRISEFLGIGTFTIPIIISCVLFYMVYKVSKRHNLDWKFQLKTTLIVMLFTSILILSDQFIGIRLL